jgi:hypothetical protein
MYSVKVDSILHVIVAYEVIQYPQPLVPQVGCTHSHWEHTLMTVLQTMIGMNKNQLEWKSNT